MGDQCEGSRESGTVKSDEARRVDGRMWTSSFLQVKQSTKERRFLTRSRGWLLRATGLERKSRVTERVAQENSSGNEGTEMPKENLVSWRLYDKRRETERVVA